MDNVAFVVDGELVVRLSKEADPAARARAVRREARLLAVVAPVATIPVPDPFIVDEEAGLLVYPKLRGRPLMDAPVPEPDRLAEPLGTFVARLHAIPIEIVRDVVDSDDYPLPAWREKAEMTYGVVARALSPVARRLVERFLGQSPPDPSETLALCHYDLGAEHILVDDATGEITGIIDWTDAALVDPMVDLALIFRDLGPDIAELTYAAYAPGIAWPAVDRARTAFFARCSLLEDIARGIRSDDRRYLDGSLSRVEHTFA